MRELNNTELEMVEGGNAALFFVVGALGAMFGFGYMAGKDMAARDDARAATAQ